MSITKMYILGATTILTVAFLFHGIFKSQSSDLVQNEYTTYAFNQLGHNDYKNKKVMSIEEFNAYWNKKMNQTDLNAMNRVYQFGVNSAKKGKPSFFEIKLELVETQIKNTDLAIEAGESIIAVIDSLLGTVAKSIETK